MNRKTETLTLNMTKSQLHRSLQFPASFVTEGKVFMFGL